MNRPPDERVPKPFGAVPEDRRGAPRRAAPPGHERWAPDGYTGAIECALTLLTPVHIGSGLFRTANGEVVKEAVRSNDVLVIPGTSLKGAFRSAAEAISDACEATNSRSACTEDKGYCVCCRIFGGRGYLGRVGYRDARPVGEVTAMIHRVPSLWAPRRSLDGRKVYLHGDGEPATAANGEPWEVIPAGTQFAFRVEVESLAKDELCLVLTAMGAFGDLTPILGGGKPRGLGSVRVAVQWARFRAPRDSALQYRAAMTELDAAALRQAVGRAQNRIDQAALRRLRELWTYPGRQPAPAGLY